MSSVAGIHGIGEWRDFPPYVQSESIENFKQHHHAMLFMLYKAGSCCVEIGIRGKAEEKSRHSTTRLIKWPRLEMRYPRVWQCRCYDPK